MEMAAKSRRVKKAVYENSINEFNHDPFIKADYFLSRLRHEDKIKYEANVREDDYGDYYPVDELMPIPISWFTGRVYFDIRKGWLWPHFNKINVCHKLYEEYRQKNIYNVTIMHLEMANIRDSYVQYSLDHHLESQYKQRISNDVYIIQSNGDHKKNPYIKRGSVKIGMSYNVNARLTALSSEIENKNYHVMAVLKCAGPLMEKALHSEFGEYKIYGEWFRPGDRIFELIERLESAHVENAPFYNCA